MSDFLNFLPIFQETADKIRARVNADANPGLSPDSPAFLDTTPGGFWHDFTQAIILELERLWDAMGTEMVAAMLPQFAWGIYLDEHGLALNLLRKEAVAATGTVTFTGTNGTVIPSGTQVATAQTNPDADPVVFETTEGGTIASGSIDLDVQAVDTGLVGNTAAGTVSVLVSPISGITAVTNAAAVSGGADEESDDDFRDRILVALAGAHGAGTSADYKSWALAYPGVGFATVEPLWNGAGTVRVIITDPDNNPCSNTIVTGLQTQLDPVAGQGQGQAPIGATVTVATPTTTAVTVSADITTKSGYSLDGSGGTVDVSQDIKDSIADYINTLAPGDDVILQHVIARVFVTGVYDVTSVLLNGSAANVTIGSLQIARVTNPSGITLT